MKIVMVMLISLLLTACSKEPSDKEINQSLIESIKETNEGIKKMQQFATIEMSGGEKEDAVALKVKMDGVLDGLMFELVNAKKVGDCVQQENPANYKCVVQATVKNKLDTTTNTTEILFTPAKGGGWVALTES